MWIVRVALDRPYTFIVLALMILILSVVAIARTPTDIFPSIDIPVTAVDWTYTGLNPEELEGRLTSVYERVLRSAAEAAAGLAAVRQRNGRTVDMRDTQIAGIVIARRATLATRNVKHFADLTAEVVNPWKAKR